MKSYELKPTDENIVNTYINDKLGRGEDVIRLVKLLNSMEDNCSLLLDSHWGQGKTFVVKQIQKVFEVYNSWLLNLQKIDENDEQIKSIRQKTKDLWQHYIGVSQVDLKNHIVVYFDAWKNDNDDDPLLSLVYSILEHFENVIPGLEFKKSFDLKDLIRWIGLISDKASKLAEILGGEKDILDSIRSSREFDNQIENLFDNLICERAERLIIIVDELDRCKPTFAIRLLERIKHYFTDDRVTFIFSTNIMELKETIKVYYGNNFDADRYLDRFFDLRINLPSVDMEKLFEVICTNSDQLTYFNVCKHVACYLKLSPREFTRYYRICEIATNGKITDKNTRIDPYYLPNFWATLYVVPLMIAVKFISIEEYNKFIEGSNSQLFADVYKDYDNSSQFCKSLLVREEWFERIDGYVYADKSARLKDFYNLVFNFEFEKHKSQKTKVGQLVFYTNMKEDIIRIGNCISNLAVY